MYSLKPTPYEVGMKIAQRHRAVRKRLKISQKDMAERSGVSKKNRQSIKKILDKLRD